MKKLIKVFYSIWVDAINYERIKNGGEDHWKVFVFLYMSILLSLNIMTFFSAILFFTGFKLTSLKEFLDNIFSNEKVSNFLWFVIIVFIPSMLINYFLIFHKKKYIYILNNYQFKNGKKLLIYFFITVLAYFGISLLNKFFI